MSIDQAFPARWGTLDLFLSLLSTGGEGKVVNVTLNGKACPACIDGAAVKLDFSATEASAHHVPGADRPQVLVAITVSKTAAPGARARAFRHPDEVWTQRRALRERFAAPAGNDPCALPANNTDFAKNSKHVCGV